MAYTESSSVITGLDATPVTKQNTTSYKGVKRCFTGMIATGTMGTVGQTYAITRLPARSKVLSVKMTNATATSGSVKMGLYRTTANGQAAIDSACLSSAINLTTVRDQVEVMTLPAALASRDSVLSANFATQVGTAAATSDVDYDLVLTVVTVAAAPCPTWFQVEVLEAFE